MALLLQFDIIFWSKEAFSFVTPKQPAKPSMCSGKGWRLLQLNALLSLRRWNFGAISPACNKFLVFRPCFLYTFRWRYFAVLPRWIATTVNVSLAVVMMQSVCRTSLVPTYIALGILQCKLTKWFWIGASKSSLWTFWGKGKTEWTRKFISVHWFLMEVIYW